MSGLIALLDDVAAISKVAAASIDDVAGQAAKAGAKAAGALIDDAAVTPKYVQGFHASRELPIVWKIAKGSIFNKLVILLPVALLLSAFAPWLITPLLMIGGAYLCFEGAEKVAHTFTHSDAHDSKKHIHPEGEGAALEEKRVAGAIKTDFILSAEIMTIALSTIPATDTLWMKALILFVVAIGITVAVYGAVALIVKADDVGVHLATGRNGALAALGRGIVKVMPGLMKTLTIVGTAAMLWVGGNIVVHGLADLGWHAPYDWIHHMAELAAHAVPRFGGAVAWLTTAFFDGILGLLLGLVLIPVATRVINPAISAIRGVVARPDQG
ncbi:MAG: ABC transporter [Paracoccus sp.]|nr:MAG: ABC transporter [Paracoccus sp. (in: a-proteobacteria)]